MRIAVATENANVSPHFGHCEGFTLFDVENNDIKAEEFVANPGHQPGFLPVFLGEHGVNMIIAGGMGERAQVLFAQNSIETIVGASGSAKDAVNSYLSGSLNTTGEVCKDHSNAGGCGEH